MYNNKIPRTLCLTISLFALLLGGCATSQNPTSTRSDALPGERAIRDRTPRADAARSVDVRTAKQYLSGDPDTPAEAAHNDVWERIRDGFRLPKLDSPTTDYYVDWYSERPKYMARMVNRASMYLYYIVEQLDEHDLPMEIALLPAVESSFNPTAYSHAHASGMWQFIAATGERYGLKQNWWYDGRRDVIAATDAAIEYLSFLRDEFDGDWFHALAAYNGGENRVQRAITSNRRRGEPTGYRHLSLRRETRRYVPKLIAFRRIVKDPERYGLALEPIPNRPYFEIVETGSQIDLNIIAEAANVPTSRLRDLNAGFRRWATGPGGPHRVLVPATASERVSTRLRRLPESERMRWASYTVQRGDTLGRIAHRYGISVGALQSTNQLNGTLIRAGQDLVVPLSTRTTSSVAAADGASVSSKGSRQWTDYRVRRGDTLSRIAQRHNVNVARLRAANELEGSLIHAGDVLRVPGAGAASTESPRPVIHQVERGDTLWGIARRYRVDVEQLQHWNELAAQDVLRLGQRITVYLN